MPHKLRCVCCLSVCVCVCVTPLPAACCSSNDSSTFDRRGVVQVPTNVLDSTKTVGSTAWRSKHGRACVQFSVCLSCGEQLQHHGSCGIFPWRDASDSRTPKRLCCGSNVFGKLDRSSRCTCKTGLVIDCIDFVRPAGSRTERSLYATATEKRGGRGTRARNCSGNGSSPVSFFSLKKRV